MITTYTLLSMSNQMPATMTSIIITSVIAAIIMIGLIIFCIVQHKRVRSSTYPSFRHNFESYLMVATTAMFLGFVILFFCLAYADNETATWLSFVLFVLVAVISILVTIGTNLFRFTFYETEIHWRTYFGKKRIYTYKDIADCFSGYKRAFLFIQIEFKDGKKKDLRATKRLVAALEDKKIKIR
ncbi:MAG: hypothetical protein FWE13_01835 [Firmicutes bacterium]|nr:hypothetical protein [Bacillota bacterium]